MNTSHPVRVLIVEDSPVVQLLLEQIINADPRLEVVATVPTGEKALKILERLKPDVISMDINLPGIDGLETTRQIMQLRPTPIVVVSSHLDSQELNISFNALKAGALCVLDKPVGPAHPQFDSIAHKLCTQLQIMSQVKVIRQRYQGKHKRIAPQPPRAPFDSLSSPTSSFRIVGLAASTGGPKALSTVLNQLEGFPLPILLVQHIADNFLEGFVNWLNAVVPFKAIIAKQDEIPQAGCIYLAPAGKHLLFEKGRLSLQLGPPVSYQCPSATVLFRSLAKNAGAEAIGIILTGMGDDGAEGLLEMHQAGAYTLAEAASTAVVYGMPGVAVKLGAVRQVLPLPDIGPHLQQILKQREAPII